MDTNAQITSNPDHTSPARPRRTRPLVLRGLTLLKSQRYLATAVGLVLAAALAACGSSSTTASPSAPPTRATPSAQPTSTELGAPPAQAAQGFGAKAASDMAELGQTRFFFPADEGENLTNPNCLHGVNELVGPDSTTSKWTTTQCRAPDPDYPGYTRYYDYDADPSQWVVTMAQGADGYIYEQNRWSLADGNIWFRYPASNPSAIEISVTPFNQATLNGFVPMSAYNQAHPQDGLREASRMAVARASLLVMQLQAFDVSGVPPYSPSEISAQESQAGVPGVLLNLNRPALANILATDPVDTMLNPS